MSNIVLIIGKSGSGKSFSLKNLDPKTSAILCAMPKDMPFRKELPIVFEDNHAILIEQMNKAAAAGRKIIVIDDYQYVMVKEFMDRVDEKGYSKFNHIAEHALSIVLAAKKLPSDVVVYFLCHSEEEEHTGREKMKTIGKMLDNVVDLQGFFNILLLAKSSGGRYFFRTESEGDEIDSVRTPEGMFKDKEIPNDINNLNNIILNYKRGE